MKPWLPTFLAAIVAYSSLGLAGPAWGDDATPLDTSLKPTPPATNDVPAVFRDMGVVQNKAMEKAGKWLFSNYMSLDFSDDPYTMYGINFDFGYAPTDFWEIYLTTTPFFIDDQRPIVNQVAALTLANGQQASINGAQAKHAYGLETIWAPLYGKDSFGLRNIIRSDSFVKFGISQIQYDQGNGMRFQLGVGKTFFIGQKAGVRVAVSENYMQTIVNQAEGYRSVLMVDFGYVLYLF